MGSRSRVLGRELLVRAIGWCIALQALVPLMSRVLARSVGQRMWSPALVWPPPDIPAHVWRGRASAEWGCATESRGRSLAKWHGRSFFSGAASNVFSLLLM